MTSTRGRVFAAVVASALIVSQPLLAYVDHPAHVVVGRHFEASFAHRFAHQDG